MKLQDIFKLSQLKFYYKYIHRDLPAYLQNFQFVTRASVHGLNTRYSNELVVPRIYHAFAENSIHYSIPKLINATPHNIAEKLYSHSLVSFSVYAKNEFIKNYSEICNILNCYICRRE